MGKNSKSTSRLLGGSMMGLDFGFGDKHEKDKLQKRYKAVLERSDHKICSDCSEEAGEAGWVCLLENPVDQNDFRLALVCCPDCATSFHELGPEVCQVKIANDDVEEDEVKALENTGNEVINSIYEGKLSPDDVEIERTKKGFIRHKYQTLKYFSKKAYEEQHTIIVEREARAEEEAEEKKKERKKADKAEKQKQKDEEKQRKKAKEAEKKKKKEEKKGEKEKEKSKGKDKDQEKDSKLDDGSINLDELNQSFALEDDETERQNNNTERLASSMSNLLNYKVKPVEGAEDEPAHTSSERPSTAGRRPKVNRRRSGRGVKELGMGGGDPLGAQSDHVPMMRRGRGRGQGHGGGGAEKRSERHERGESPSRKPRASHSPVPGRVSRPNARKKDKDKDPLASQSDHVSTSRRKARERRLKDIHWDPSDLPAETLNASRKITPSLISQAQKDMASSFDGLGFDDIDYESFQNRVAPGQYFAVQTTSQHDGGQQQQQQQQEKEEYDDDDEDDDGSNPDLGSGDESESESDFAHDEDDVEEEGTPEPASEEPTAVEEEEALHKPRRSGKSSTRPRREHSPKPPSSRDDGEDQGEDREGKRREGTGERKKRSERHAKGEGHGNKDGRPRRSKKPEGRRKRVPESGDSKDESGDGDHPEQQQEGGNGGEGITRRRKPSSSTQSGRTKERSPVARTISGGSADGRDSRRPVRRTDSGGDAKPRRGDRRVSTENRGHMGRRAKAKMHASVPTINFDHLALDDDDDPDEEEEEEELETQSTGALEDGNDEEEEGKSKKSKKGSLAKLKKKTAGVVKGTVKGTISTISTIDPRKKKSTDGPNEGPVSDDDNEDAESVTLTASAG